MKECKECYHPATMDGLCPYCGPDTIPNLLHRLGIKRQDLQTYGSWSERTIDRICKHTRQLSELELRGLITYGNSQ